MSRNHSKKHIPFCPRNIPLVDQYMWPVKDTNVYGCINGISTPIYNCDGTINRHLPLENYPLVGSVHREIFTQEYLNRK